MCCLFGCQKRVTKAIILCILSKSCTQKLKPVFDCQTTAISIWSFPNPFIFTATIIPISIGINFVEIEETQNFAGNKIEICALGGFMVSRGKP